MLKVFSDGWPPASEVLPPIAPPTARSSTLCSRKSTGSLGLADADAVSLCISSSHSCVLDSKDLILTLTLFWVSV